jgi:hypothetical protein
MDDAEDQRAALRQLLGEAAVLIRGVLAATGTLSSIQKAAFSYSVPIFTVKGQGGQFIGSGTFVLANGQHYVLTAAHVWWALRGAERFALKLMEGEQFLVFTPDQVILRSLPEVMPESREGWSIDGPDLALIALPDAATALIEGPKHFYDLGQRPEPAPSQAGLGIWGVLGFPVELSQLEAGSPRLELFVGLFHSFVVTKSEQGDLDYIDVRYDREQEPDQPRQYDGASGGGLWHAAFSEGGAWTLSLEGVAFWQEPQSAKRGFIRCHGRRTVDLLVQGMPSRPRPT